MRNIQDLISNVEKYNKVLLQRSFKSKKNIVAYVLYNGQPRIFKWFVPGLQQNLTIEYNVLRKGFPNLLIPTPFEKDLVNNILIMSYIIGENVCDILNNSLMNIDEKQKITHQLADWFAHFHSFFKSEDTFLLRGDASLRNFILSRDRIWGVDFEESRIGKPAEDLATLCASLLSSNPMFIDEKFQLCKIFLNSYRKLVKWNIENINAEISYALLERIQWRPTDEELLRKYAINIRNKGLITAIDMI